MNEQHDSAPYAGRYAGSAIRLTNRRTTAGQQERSTRKRYAAQPEPNHRQGHSFGIHPADEPYDSDSFDVEGADYPGEPMRPRSSAVRQPTVPSRQRETVQFPSQQPKPTRVFRRVDRATMVIWLCLALIVMVGGWWLLSVVANWWQGVQDNLKYGIPRTFQADQYVGLGDSLVRPDHFIALNLHGVIEVIQINPQDHTKDAVYVLTSVDNTWDDDPDKIFRSAVSEIETQPLLPQSQEISWPVVIVMLAFLLSFMGGTVMALITYPTVTIDVVPVTKSVSVTMPLALPTRALAPVTLSRSATAPTSGKGHQDARAATGSVTVYNGLFTAQTLPAGTVLTGADGVQIATDAPVTIPAVHPPLYGQATVGARALTAGKAGNIGAGDINLTVLSGVLVKNSVFSGGRDARDFQAVAQADLDQVTSTLKGMLNRQEPLAFALRPGEVVQPLDCTFNETPTHHVGEEAATVMVRATTTCKGMAYGREQLNQQATQAFTVQASPGAPYQLVGEVQVQVVDTTPFTVSCRGVWVYTLSQDYEQFLAERIAGDSPQQAHKYLLHTGFLTHAIVPDTLPPDPAHIHFQVFIGL